MKFHELAVGDRFLFNGKEYTKTKESRISCCKIKQNCVEANTSNAVVLKPMDEVEKIN